MSRSSFIGVTMQSPSIKQYSAADTLGFLFNYNRDESTALKQAAVRNPDVDINLLRRIALWKLDRVMNVSDELIDKLRALATDATVQLDSELTRSLLSELLACDGIGLPMASTILKFLRPDRFPIIDVRAYRALKGTKPYFSQSETSKNIECYIAYAKEVCDLAVALKRPLDEIDEQLYCFDKEHNGKI